MSTAQLQGIDEIECVTPDLNGVPRGKVMTAEGFLEGRRLQMARGVLLQCIMGGYPPAKFYGSDDGDLALVAEPTQVHRLPWSDTPRALAICDAVELEDGVVPDGFYAVPVETGVSNSQYVRILSGVEEGVEVFTRYQQAAPNGGDTTSQGEEPSDFPGGGEMPDFSGGEMPDFGGGMPGGMGGGMPGGGPMG